MHYYQFHIGDYRAATAHLTNDEDLAYRRLLDMYYDTETPIPLDIDWVSRRLRLGQDVIENVLKDMFKLSVDGYIHTRCDSEIQKYHSKADSARKANQIRWGSEKVLKSDADQILTNNHKPITNNQEIKNTIVGARGTRLPPDWELSEDQKQFCVKERPDLDPVKVSAGFKDYWISVAGAKGVKKDWDATWRNWVRNQKAQLVVAPKQSTDWWVNDRRIK
jgi:uncharacterized protein YdaU (DUF1376 family)